MTKTPWETIKRKFTRGVMMEDGTNHFPTVKELSKEYNISTDAIYSQIHRHDWNTKRSEYQQKVENKIDEEKSALEARNIIESELLIEETVLSGILAAKKHFENIHKILDNGGKTTGFDIRNTQESVRIGLDVLQTLRGENISKIQLESSQNVKLDITDPDFMEQELEFAKKLIDSKKRPE